ncbi:MAG: energy-coupling factor ABC transporter permease [Bifidobacteriaceae bacterium]|jgi:cobalt/nickel transport system permease protein|nr:energy-coupling factor ABC transporter permease [Bifidobacteriaceae bacterium]
MHVPDHFLNDPTSIATGLLAAGALAAAVRQSRRPTWAWANPGGEAGEPSVLSLKDRGGAPAFAATTALVFGLQMLNYPVAQGTSGHLLGGALAAALLGPARGILAVSTVLVVQGLAFADGGLTALGTNILLMAVVATLTGWAVERPRAKGPLGIAAVAALGAAVSVPVTAAAFTALYAIGGTVPVGLGSLAGSMMGLHALIGLGEGLITGLVVGVVAAWAPGFAAIDARPLAGRPAAFALGGLAVIAAALLSPLASGWPDGLESAAETVGFADAARSHAFEASALADYGSATGLSVGLVGLIGLVVCAALAFAAAPLLRARRLATA